MIRRSTEHYESRAVHFYRPSLASLGRGKDYRFVLAESRGAKVRFLRDDVRVDVPEFLADAIHLRCMTDLSHPLFDLFRTERLQLVEIDADPSSQ